MYIKYATKLLKIFTDIPVITKDIVWENHGNTDKGETFNNKKVFIPVIDQIIKQYIITPFVGFFQS